MPQLVFVTQVSTVTLVLVIHKRTNAPLVTTVNVVHSKAPSAPWEPTTSMLVVRLSRTVLFAHLVTIVSKRVCQLAQENAQTVTTVSLAAELLINSLHAQATTPTRTLRWQRTEFNLRLSAHWVPTTTSTVNTNVRLAHKATTVMRKV